jgi:hypothetical protein
VYESGLVRIHWTINGVYILCINAALPPRLLEDLQSIVPKVRMSNCDEYQWNGESYRAFEAQQFDIGMFRLSSLNALDRYVALWVVKRFCEMGWEPFEAESYFTLRPTPPNR